MDALAIEAAEAAVHCGYPGGAGAVLIVELDGAAIEVVRTSSTQVERLLPRGRRLRDPHRGRRRRAGAVLEGAQVRVRRGRPDQPRLHRPGRRHPADGAARGAAPDRASSPPRSGVRVANVFHAGDGNLHPLVLFDDAVPGESERAEEVSGAILDLCIEHGGSITGEHGVGSDKAKYMPRMFDRGRPRHDAAGPLRVRPRLDLQPRQGVPHARACAARCPGGTGARTRWPRPAWRRSSDGRPRPASSCWRRRPTTPAAAADADVVDGVPARWVARPGQRRARRRR